jgi:hypothetical protein
MVPQGSILSPTLHSMFINDSSQIPRVYLILPDNDTWKYSRYCKRVYVPKNLQRCLSSMNTRCEPRNTQINEDHSQVVGLSHRFRPAEAFRALNGGHTPSLNNLKYLGVISDKKIVQYMHIEMI